jgi:hypothetical protein
MGRTLILIKKNFTFVRLERLYGMITDLYIDHNKFKVTIM